MNTKQLWNTVGNSLGFIQEKGYWTPSSSWIRGWERKGKEGKGKKGKGKGEKELNNTIIM